MDRPTKVEVGQRWRTPGGYEFTIAAGTTSGDALAYGATFLGWRDGYGPKAPAFACAAGCTCHPVPAPACREYAAGYSNFPCSLLRGHEGDHVARNSAGERVRSWGRAVAAIPTKAPPELTGKLPCGCAGIACEVNHAKPAFKDCLDCVAIDGKCGKHGGKAHYCGINCYATGCPEGRIAPPTVAPVPLNRFPAMELTDGTRPLTALESIRSRKPPEAWRPSVDDWDLLPDAGR